jgi:ribonuclease HI
MTHIYTDGACLLNTRGDLAIGLCGFYDQTREVFAIDNELSFDTNSYIMELKAVYLALEYIKSDTIIFCDSMQVIDNIATKGKKPKAEIEQQVRKLFESKNKVHNIQIQWVKSHGDCVGNNLIDQKLEQEMVVLIGKMKSEYSNLIVEKVRARYKLKGAFESFSQEFFTSLLG